jgi:ppGpp synthetase/RelA/SpoT-type nucleotidyltranferase/CheY-like chemotaxis protein
MIPIMQQNLHTILLIDDNYSKFIDCLSIVGKSYGFTIQAFDTVDAGLDYLESNKREVGAVLLDLSFTPNKYEGIEALQQIKNKYTLLPVIILTGNQSEKDITMAINCMRDGAFNYIAKTNFDPIFLFQMLKIAINHYLSNSELERYNALKEEYRSKVFSYEKMLYTTEMILHNTLKDKLMFPPSFEKRIKDFKSFYDKVKNKELSEGFITDPFKRFSDIVGLRVIFYNAVDLHTAVDLLQATNDFVDMKTGSSLIADDKSKTYGYRAVHFDVKLNAEKRLHLDEYKMLSNIPCEVQFKTIFAHSWSKVYHALSYKEIGEIKLTQEEKQKLNMDFKEAAKNLEDVEQQITDLCSKYSPNTKSIPNAN